MRSIRPAEDVKVAPDAVGSEERNVRSVAHTVIGIPKDSLPGGFGPSLTSSTHNTAGGRRTGGATARSATAGDGGLKQGAEEGVITEAAWAISCRISLVLREQRPGTRVIPRDLRDIGDSRTESGCVGRVPVSAVAM